MKWRQGVGEENALQKKGKKQRGCMYGKGKGRVRTVYSQMNERVTGEVMKNHVKKRKSKSASQSLTRSPVSSHSGVLFFLLFPAILPIPIQPSLLPKSIPYWSPFSSLPPPVFLASAGTLSPTSLSLSVFLAFSRRPCSPFSPHSLPLSPSSVHSSDTLFFNASEYKVLKKGF